LGQVLDYASPGWDTTVFQEIDRALNPGSVRYQRESQSGKIAPSDAFGRHVAYLFDCGRTVGQICGNTCASRERIEKILARYRPQFAQRSVAATSAPPSDEDQSEDASAAS
jgi:hypothetical protein